MSLDRYKWYKKTLEEMLGSRKTRFTEEYMNARSHNVIVAKWLTKLNEEFIFNQKQLIGIGLERFSYQWKELHLSDKRITLAQAFEYTLNECGIKGEEIGSLTMIALDTVLSEMIMFVESKRVQTDLINNTISKGSNLKWAGEETEFLQLIDSLIETGRLQISSNKNKWDSISEVAEFFGFKLGENPIGNLSKSKINTKMGYSPKFLIDMNQYWKEIDKRKLTGSN